MCALFSFCWGFSFSFLLVASVACGCLLLLSGKTSSLIPFSLDAAWNVDVLICLAGIYVCYVWCCLCGLPSVLICTYCLVCGFANFELVVGILPLVHWYQWGEGFAPIACRPLLPCLILAGCALFLVVLWYTGTNQHRWSEALVPCPLSPLIVSLVWSVPAVRLNNVYLVLLCPITLAMLNEFICAGSVLGGSVWS
jgi:hypothetical protein